MPKNSAKRNAIFSRWMEEATPSERNRLAKHAGVRVTSLYHIASGYRRASVKVALRIESGTTKLERPGLERLSRDSFTNVCRGCPLWQAVRGAA